MRVINDNYYGEGQIICKGTKDEEVIQEFEEDLLTTEDRGDFHIGQDYKEAVCETLICIKCGTDKFIIGIDDYYTAVKCSNCGYEICVHQG